jgi:hypothetical protein
MAKYDVIHKETGETKVIDVSVHDITQWYVDNPLWKRDWSQGCCAAQDIGEWRDKLIAKKPGWNDVLDKASRVRGSRVSKI